MIERSDIERVRQILTDNIGKRIQLSAKKGRKRVTIRRGVIKETYPSIFVLLLDSISEFASTERTISFSYADILTKSIEIIIVETKQTVE